MKTVVKFSLAFILTVFLANGVLAQSVADKEYNQYLINSLQDENVGIRSSAAELLGERKVESAVEPLLKMLKTENNPSVRIIVAVALYNIGDEKSLPALKQVAARDKSKTVRRVASAIVHKMENPQVAQK